MKLIKDFYGVPTGAIYPLLYKKGDECPPELIQAAQSVGAVEPAKGKRSNSAKTAEGSTAKVEEDANAKADESVKDEDDSADSK